MTEPLFQLTDVYKEYHRDGRDPLQVLSGICLTVTAGEFLTITGQSGSGKSTLLQLMAAFDKPSSGSLTFRNQNMNAWSDRELSRYRNESVGFIFQFHHLLPEFSAEENVLMPRLIGAEKKHPADEKRAAELLELVGLAGRRDHKPGQLSGGEQQRVAIARALMNAPEVLFADEPTGNLDTTNSEQVFSLLSTIHRNLKTTLVVVTHNTELARTGTRHLELKDGQFIGN